MGTASRSVETLPAPPPEAVANSAGGPTAPRRKRTLSGWKLAFCVSHVRKLEGQPVENFHRLSMGFAFFHGFYPCYVDNFDTCLFNAGQQLAARLGGPF
jgi:hypothetical protein